MSFDAAKERYGVELRDGARLALRRANLLQRLRVRLCALEGAAAAHNGEAGTLVECDAAASTYGVELESGEVLRGVPAGSAVLPDGALATVGGLQSAAQYNGRLARVLSHDEAAARYAVELDGGKGLRVRRQNLLA